MCPEFFHIGPIAIRAYGVMLSLSFFIGLWLIQREARRVGVNPDRIATLGFVLIIFGVIGARLGYVLYHWSEFSNDLLSIINPFASGEYVGIAGLNLQGGLILGFVAGLLYLRRHRISPRRALDAVAPAVAFGIFLTRIGCYLNGCCFGTPTDAFLGVQFPEGSPAWYVFGDAHVHPTQLYSSLYGLALMVVLMAINRRYYRVGLATGVFFMVEALARFIIEFWRYYESEMWLHSLGIDATFNQVVAAAMFVTGVVFVVTARKPADIERNRGSG
ncbi:MAG: prolipoprotein diacylglyceryl transferase [candidate division Zixibacteria bacterium]|nr:prolipoprotein diacylglyceryl transferase [candidate division Zixibacteria bacterium]